MKDIFTKEKSLKTLLMKFDWKVIGKNDNGMSSLKVEIYGSNFSINQGEWPEVEDIYVTLDGKESQDFGETFVGTKLDGFDLLLKAISIYVNEALEMTFEYVCDDIKTYKNEFMKNNISLGLATKSKRHIYERILNSSLEELKFEACYFSYGAEHAAYVGAGTFAIIKTEDGSLETSYEHLYISHIVDSTKEKDYRIEISSESFKEVLKAYDIDTDELFKRCKE